MIKIERTITIHRPMQEVFAYLCEVERGQGYISGQVAPCTARNGFPGP